MDPKYTAGGESQLRLELTGPPGLATQEDARAEWPMNLIEWKLDEAKAIGGCAMDGEEVGVVGLVSRIGRQAGLLRCQGVDDPPIKFV